MIAIACMFLLAASTRVDLVDEVYQIPAGDWRWTDFQIKRQTALVMARFEVESGARAVRLALIRHEDLQRLTDGQSHTVLDETEAAASGSLTPQYRAPGHYVLVVENRGPAPATVHLRVSLDFAQVTRLSPGRQLTVVAISFAAFFGIVTWSARKLLRGIKG
jgi:hypothetical protein